MFWLITRIGFDGLHIAGLQDRRSEICGQAHSISNLTYHSGHFSMAFSGPSPSSTGGHHPGTKYAKREAIEFHAAVPWRWVWMLMDARKFAEKNILNSLKCNEMYVFNIYTYLYSFCITSMAEDSLSAMIAAYCSRCSTGWSCGPVQVFFDSYLSIVSLEALDEELPMYEVLRSTTLLLVRPLPILAQHSTSILGT